MKLSKRGEYAIRALIRIAQDEGKALVSIHELASKERIPIKFLEAILLTLKNAGLLQSRRGIHGGYLLNKPTTDITLGEIIRLMNGPLAPLGCVSVSAPSKCSCPDMETCGLKAVMQEVRNAIVAILDSTTLADVAERTKTLQMQQMQKKKVMIFNI